MQTYTAPLRDIRFNLHELHGTGALAAMPRFAEFTPELYDSVLDEAAKIMREVLLPLNASGDAEGCRLENGVVRTPQGFRAAYDSFREAGWAALAGDPEWGGQGLPETMYQIVVEMICGANFSFSLYPGLTRGATQALEGHGSEELKRRYLPKLVSGEWTGTMCLTEPQCGTDLGLLRTRATPRPDGSYALTGNKIFISAGDHDLASNIVHLVLARLPDAPAGIKGVSMFLVPKFLPAGDERPNASLGPRNGVVCTALEHKMGIKASATCQLSFEEATGWLVGVPHKGMQAMFTMMNAERLAVGVSGLGIAEAAYQSAVAYAKDRLQGRSVAGAKYPDRAADPIIVHPDIRRTLMTMRATTEGCRALAGWVAQALDLSAHASDPETRREAADFTALMTPIVKALFTDLGFETASLGVQVHGGHGYIRDHGVEQYVRDARIAMIYEGANGIQALDLVGRKLGQHNGRLLRRFFHPVAAFIDAHRGHAQLGGFVKPLERAFGALQLATGLIAEKGLRDPEEAGAAATEYLRLFGLVALGFMWARAAQVALEKLPAANGDAAFYRNKLTTARFYMERVLPQAASLYAGIKSGKAAMMELDEAAF